MKIIKVENCPNCDGSGRNVIAADETGIVATEICKECKGRGWNRILPEVRETCSNCNGTGKISIHKSTDNQWIEIPGAGVLHGNS